MAQINKECKEKVLETIKQGKIDAADVSYLELSIMVQYKNARICIYPKLSNRYAALCAS